MFGNEEQRVDDDKLMKDIITRRIFRTRLNEFSDALVMLCSRIQERKRF